MGKGQWLTASAAVCAMWMLAGCSKDGQIAKVEAEAKPGDAKAAQQTKPAAGQVRLTAASQQQAGIETVVVAASLASQTIQANGQLTTNEDQTWHVGAVAEGKVVEVLVKAGDTVKDGQVLAYMHSHAIHETRAAYKQALAERDRAEANLSYAKRVSARAARLLALQAISQEQADQAENDVRTAEASLRKAQADIEKERQHLTEFLDVPLEDSHGSRKDGVDPDSVPIKAPAAGTIFKRLAGPGTVLSVGGEAFTIANTSSLWMIANVNEADLSGLRPGQVVEITVNAYPGRTFTGQVLRLGEELDPATRTLKVRVLIPNPNGLLKPEMYAMATIRSAGSRSVLTVPASASLELNGQKAVFLQTGADTFEPRVVQVVDSRNGVMEIGEGLRPGDRVVVKGGFVLKAELLRSSLQSE